MEPFKAYKLRLYKTIRDAFEQCVSCAQSASHPATKLMWLVRAHTHAGWLAWLADYDKNPFFNEGWDVVERELYSSVYSLMKELWSVRETAREAEVRGDKSISQR